MKKIVFICMILFFLISGILLFKNNSAKIDQIDTEEKSLTAKFIKSHLFDKDKTLRTNFVGETGSELALSESMGLWLEYLSGDNKQQQFNEAYDTIKSEFMMKQGLIAWQILDGETATTNALIDDIRIIEALFKEGESTGNQQLIKEAITLSKAIVKYNYNDEFLVDFYDEEYGYANGTLTVSYLNVRPFKYMNEYDVISDEQYREIEQFMRDIPMQGNFYPITYHVKERAFEFSNEINLIDQLYIALHLERTSVNTDKFNDWLQNKEDESKKLFGRYDAYREEPIVTYESVAVYALIVLYAIERDDEKFAQHIWKKVKEFQVQGKSSEYYGGYVNNYQTHSFDNLLALIAERELKNEGIIQ